MNILYNTSFNVHFVVVVVIQSSDVDSKTPALLLINSTAEIFYQSCTAAMEHYILYCNELEAFYICTPAELHNISTFVLHSAAKVCTRFVQHWRELQQLNGANQSSPDCDGLCALPCPAVCRWFVCPADQPPPLGALLSSLLKSQIYL